MRDRTTQILAGIVTLAAALRFPTLDVQSFWSDEAVTVLLLDGSFFDLLEDIPDSESTPPLYYALAWPWTQLFGTGEVGLRSLSALFGTLCVPAAFLAARELVSARAGLVAAALVATNPLLVWYSQEARAYALLVLLATLSLLFFARALRGDREGLAGWALTAALALGTHYFALFVVLPQALWLLWRVRPLRGTAAAVAVPGAAGLVLLPLALHQRSNEGAAFIEDSGLGFRLAQVPKQFLVAFDAPAEVLLTVLAAALAAAGLALLALRAPRADQHGAAVAAAIGAAALLIPLALAVAGVDFILTRNLIAALVPLLIVFAAGLGARAAGVTGPAVAAALCTLWAVLIVWVAAEPDYHRQNWRGAAQVLGPPAVDRVVVATPVNGSEPLQVYLPGARVVRFDEVIPVREVDYLGLVRRSPGEEAVQPLEPTPDAPGLGGFTLVERVQGEQFLVLRYAGPAPQPARPPEIARFKLDDGFSVILHQPSGAGAADARRPGGS
ncbi:MAG: glycosyltransferase family 39 protein [Thermoleophilaceae bacterium]